MDVGGVSEYLDVFKSELPVSECTDIHLVGRWVTSCRPAAHAHLRFRVEAQSKTMTLSEKAVKDLAQYNVEMQELERIIAHEHRLKTFMNTKNQERADEDPQDISRRQGWYPAAPSGYRASSQNVMAHLRFNEVSPHSQDFCYFLSRLELKVCSPGTF